MRLGLVLEAGEIFGNELDGDPAGEVFEDDLEGDLVGESVIIDSLEDIEFTFGPVFLADLPVYLIVGTMH